MVYNYITIMSIDSFNKKILSLGRNGRWAEGIPLIKKELQKHNLGNKLELTVSLAAFLYHNAFQNGTFDIKSDANSKSALKICRDIIDNNPHSKEKSIINARIFLAQMLAAAHEKEAINIARTTYRMCQDALTANRLANVYEILGKKMLAEKYYLIYEDLSKKDKQHLPYVYLNLANFYKNIDNVKRLDKYIGKIKKTRFYLSNRSFRNLVRVRIQKSQ